MNQLPRLGTLLLCTFALLCQACDAEESDAAPAGGAGGGGGEGGAGPEPLPFPPAGPDAVPDPGVMGPYPVGVSTVTLFDEARESPAGGPRRLVTEIWYPAVEAARAGAPTLYDIRDYMTEEQRAQTADITAVELETPAVRDAAVRADAGRFPLIIFAHGQGALRWQSTYYTVHLASHGYVVVSVDHEKGTLAELLRDTMESTAEGLFSRSDDVLFLLDELPTQQVAIPAMKLTDFTRVGVTGHSFGAVTSFRTAALDDRIDVIVPQAPASADLSWLGVEAPVILGIPVLVQAGHLDQTLEWDQNVVTTWALLQSPRWLLDLVHGGHFTFADLCAFDLASIAERLNVDGGFPGVDIREALSDGCAPPAPAPEVAQKLINHSATALFNAVLRDSPGSLAHLDQAELEAIGPGEVVLTTDAP